MSMREHKQNHLSTKTTSTRTTSTFLGAGNRHHFLIPLLFLCMLTLAASAFADTHTSHIEVTPNIVAAGSGINFSAEVFADTGDPIHEFRIYEHNEFSNFVCDLATGWNGPYMATNTIGDFCFWTAQSGQEIYPGNSKVFTYSADTPGTECCRTWLMETRDPEGYYVFLNPDICIDTTPPETTKSFIGPQKIDPATGIEWIDGVTLVDLYATDTIGPHDAGIEETKYVNILAEQFVEDYYLDCDPELPCRDSGYCQSLLPYADHIPSQLWQTYFEPFPKAEESCHVLFYQSVDGVGNEEAIKVNCFFVDKTPPEAIKEVGDPKVALYGERESGEYVEELVINSDPNSPTIYVRKTIEEDKVIWDFEFEDQGDSFCNYGHTEFGLVIGFSDDQAEFQVGTGQNMGGGSPPVYQACDGGPDPTYGCWAGGSGPTHTLPTGMIVDNPGGTGEPGYGDTVFHVEIPMEYLNSGNFYWALSTYGGQNYGYCRNGYQDFPDSWVKWSGTGIYAGSGIKDWWVQDHVTEITMDCEDQLPHPSGDEEVCYYVSYDLEPYDLTAQYCPEGLETVTDAGYEGDWCCVPAPETVIFVEDSLHDLEYFCRDAVNKKSPIDLEWFRVDSVPPEITKTMIGDDHLGECPPGPNPQEPCYVADDGKNGVRIDVADPDPTGMGCNVDEVICIYELWWEDNPTEGPIASGEFGEEGKDIIFEHDSTHTLKIWCEDALGNEVYDEEEFLVDSTPPVTTKIYGEPHYPANINDPAAYPHWITSTTLITLTAEDAKVGVDKTYYRNFVVDNIYCESEHSGCSTAVVEEGGWIEYLDPFTEPEDSCHLIEFYSIDLLGNDETVNRQCVFVDNKAPVMGEKVVGSPQVDCEAHPEDCEYDVDYYITMQTPVTISCTDADPHPVDHVSLKYRYRTSEDCTWIGDEDWTGWFDPTGPEVGKTIYFPEDSCHELEYKCEDALGNATEVYREIDVVDTVGPEITVEVEGPQIGDCEHFEEDCYIDGVTLINVGAVDPEPHPVDEVLCDWGYTVSPTGASGGDTGVTPPFVINFPEESEHSLQIDCYDALGNETTWKETFLVDKTPPEITKTYEEGDPYFSEEGKEWITSETDILMSAVDPDPHPSGLKSLEYRITLVTDNYCENQDICQEAPGSGDWAPVEGPARIAEQSCHLIEIKAIDNVDKEEIHKQCVFVDNAPPEPIKTVGDPNTEWHPTEDEITTEEYMYLADACWSEDPEIAIDCWKVTLLTPIDLACEDPIPHPVDHEIVCFNVEVDGDDETANYCEEYGGSPNDDGYCCMDQGFEDFYFLEETEHNLKYYCVDALGNEGPVDDEKFKVEGDPFEIELNKKWNLVSVPFVLLNPAIDKVLEDVEENVESVWTYDPLNEICNTEWCVYHPGSPDTSNLPTMEPGWGYWLAAFEDDVLTIGGSLFSPSATPPSRNLVGGWNLIGYYGIDDGESEAIMQYDGPDGEGRIAHCALWSLGSSVWDKGWTALLSYWEPLNPRQWYTHSSDMAGLEKMDRMDPGAGYWVSIPEDYIYNPTTSCGFLFDMMGSP